MTGHILVFQVICTNLVYLSLVYQVMSMRCAFFDSGYMYSFAIVFFGASKNEERVCSS